MTGNLYELRKYEHFNKFPVLSIKLVALFYYICDISVKNSQKSKDASFHGYSAM